MDEQDSGAEGGCECDADLRRAGSRRDAVHCNHDRAHYLLRVASELPGSRMRNWPPRAGTRPQNELAFVRGRAAVATFSWSPTFKQPASSRTAGQARYETRILVRRPSDPARFNGTVVVEWLDAPGGVEGDPEFLWENAELLRAGFAWVGVTTDGTVGQPDSIPWLKLEDPSRYGVLMGPGNECGYSIYSQAAEALLHPDGTNPLGSLHPTALIADGDSGAAHPLVTYANAIQPVDRLFDGFLIHNRGSNSAAIGEGQPKPADARTRTDRGVPVLTVESESDVLDPGVPALD